MKYLSKKADGVLLRWALAQALGVQVFVQKGDVLISGSGDSGAQKRFDPLIQWDQAGPLFEAFDIFPSRFYACSQGNPNAYQAGAGSYWVRGVSPLHAGCRSLLIKLSGVEFEVEDQVLSDLGLMDTLFDEPCEEMVVDFARSKINTCVQLLEQGGGDEISRRESLGGIRSVLELAAKQKDSFAEPFVDRGVQSTDSTQLIDALRVSSKVLNCPAPGSGVLAQRLDEILGNLKRIAEGNAGCS